MIVPENTVVTQAHKISELLRAGMEMRIQTFAGMKDAVLLASSMHEEIFGSGRGAAAYIDMMEGIGRRHIAFLARVQPHGAIFYKASKREDDTGPLGEKAAVAVHEFGIALDRSRVLLKSHDNGNGTLQGDMRFMGPRHGIAAMHDSLIVGAAEMEENAMRRDALVERLSRVFGEAADPLAKFKDFGRSDRGALRETLRDLRAFKINYP